MKSLVEIILLAFALAMDCFTVSVVCGVLVRRIKAGLMLRLAFLFGFFQALMPLIGWALANYFQTYIEAVDHWIAFGLLCVIGIEMIADAFKKEENKTIDPYGLKSELLLAVATSIDALAIGISFACTGYSSVSQIWLPLWIMSILGFCLGVRFGETVTKKVKPELLGGLILIGIGIKILIEHLA